MSGLLMQDPPVHLGGHLEVLVLVIGLRLPEEDLFVLPERGGIREPSVGAFRPLLSSGPARRLFSRALVGRMSLPRRHRANFRFLWTSSRVRNTSEKRSAGLAPASSISTSRLKSWGFGREGSWSDRIFQMPATRMLATRTKRGQDRRALVFMAGGGGFFPQEVESPLCLGAPVHASQDMFDQINAPLHSIYLSDK